MKLFLQTVMIFFATLLAAALVALGEPASVEVQMVGAAPEEVLVALLALDEAAP